MSGITPPSSRRPVVVPDDLPDEMTVTYRPGGATWAGWQGVGGGGGGAGGDRSDLLAPAPAAGETTSPEPDSMAPRWDDVALWTVVPAPGLGEGAPRPARAPAQGRDASEEPRGAAGGAADGEESEAPILSVSLQESGGASSVFESPGPSLEPSLGPSAGPTVPWGGGGGRHTGGGAAFVLLRPIGHGGMGEVFEAEQLSLRRLVAVKRLLPEVAEDPERLGAAAAAFRQEAQLSARLEHPNIVPVHDLGHDADGLPLLAMKLVEGRPWNEMLREDRARLEPADFLAKHLPILIDMANAVAFAHSRGIVHRDLKPAQVMVGAFGEVLLSDWGLALHLPEFTPSMRHHPVGLGLPTRETATSPSGTPALMAPEQTDPTALRVGPWTDVYLLGGTLYYLLTGAYPHQAPTAQAAFVRASEGIVEPPAERAPGRTVPADLAELAMRCLARDPMDRPVSALEVVHGLEAHLSGATRHRESRALAEEVARRAGGLHDYAGFNAALADADRALQLWGENAAAAELRIELTRRCGELALDRGDLVLARIHAERLEGWSIATTLGDRVAEREARRRRRERQRRIALAATAVLLVVVVAGTTAFTFLLRGERDAAHAARQAAEVQEAISFERLEGTRGLVDYMLDSLRDELDLSLPGDLRVAESVARGVFEYYRAIDPSGYPVRLRAAQVRQHQRVARALARLDFHAEADQLIASALRVARTLPDPSLAASLEVDRSLRLAHEGRLEEARAMARAARATLVSQDDGRTQAAAEAEIALGQIESELGDSDESLASYRRALEISRDLPDGDIETTLEALLGASRELHRLYRFDEAMEAVVEAENVLRRAGVAEARPHRMASLRFWQGRILAGQRRLAAALGAYEEARDLVVRTFGERHSMIVSITLAMADAHGEDGRYDEAIREAAAAEDLARRLFGVEHRVTASAMFEHGRMLGLGGRTEEGLRLSEAAIDITRRTAPDDLPTLVNMLNWTSNLRYRTGDRPGAITAAREALRLAPPERATGNSLATVSAGMLAFMLGQATDPGELREAADISREVMAIFVERHGERHPDTLVMMTLHAVSLANAGDLEEALVVSRRMVELTRAVGPDISPAYLLDLLAGHLHVLRRAGDVDGQLAIAPEVRDLVLRHFDVSAPRRAKSLRALAVIEARGGDEEAFREAVALWRESAEAALGAEGEAWDVEAGALLAEVGETGRLATFLAVGEALLPAGGDQRAGLDLVRGWGRGGVELLRSTAAAAEGGRDVAAAARELLAFDAARGAWFEANDSATTLRMHALWHAGRREEARHWRAVLVERGVTLVEAFDLPSGGAEETSEETSEEPSEGTAAD